MIKLYFKAIEVVVLGQRWEIEFGEDGSVDIEKFISDCNIFDVHQLEVSLSDLSD